MMKFRRATARRLRANQTGAEMMLWKHLRRLETKGTHFRRQVPIGSYVTDFACLASRLVIELDGSHHGEEPNKLRDDERTRWLQAEGYRVLRFWNNDVLGNIEGVIEAIAGQLSSSPSQPSAGSLPLPRERGIGAVSMKRVLSLKKYAKRAGLVVLALVALDLVAGVATVALGAEFLKR
jgi:very-short-patch-repair endonuclease